MKTRPDGSAELDDAERGGLIVSAACQAILWAMVVGTLNVVMALIWFPDNFTKALWWYPFAFVVVFFWKRHTLLKQAQEIIERTNKPDQA